MNERRTKHVSTRSHRPHWPVAPLLVAVAPLAMVLFTLATLVSPVADSGALVPWLGPYEVVQVRFAGFHVYREDVVIGTKDALTGAALLGTAGTSALLAHVLRARGDRQTSRTWLVLGAAAAFLALDELLSVHETVGLNLGWARSIPAVDHPDDAIVSLYLVGAAVLGWRLRRALLASRATVTALVAAGGLGVAAVLVDLGPSEMTALEESLELGSAATLLAGLAALAAHDLRADGPVVAGVRHAVRGR